MSNITSVSAEFGGQTLTIETGRMARLAGGAVTVTVWEIVAELSPAASIAWAV